MSIIHNKRITYPFQSSLRICFAHEMIFVCQNIRRVINEGDEND